MEKRPIGPKGVRERVPGRDPQPAPGRGREREANPVLQDATWGGHETDDVTLGEKGWRSDRTRSEHVVGGIECHPMGNGGRTRERRGKDTHGNPQIMPPCIETQEHEKYMCCPDRNGEPIRARASHKGPNVIPSMLIAHNQSMVQDMLPSYEDILQNMNGLSQRLCCS